MVAVFSKRYSSTCVVGDNGPSDIGGVQYIPSVGAHVARVEMEKMGHIPVRTMRSATVQMYSNHLCVLTTNRSASSIFWLPRSHSGQVSFSGLMEASSFAAHGFDMQD